MKAIILLLIYFLSNALAEKSPYEITIEAFVDGPSSLRFTKSGFFWHNGANAKPGRHNAKNEATYVNGNEWIPKWRKNTSDRGEDMSDIYQWNIPSLDLKMDLVSVTTERGKSGIEHRKEIELKHQGNEFIITIPDPEPGARWYKIVVRAPDPLKPTASTPK